MAAVAFLFFLPILTLAGSFPLLLAETFFKMPFDHISSELKHFYLFLKTF